MKTIKEKFMKIKGIQGRLTFIFILLSTIPLVSLGFFIVNQQITSRQQENIRNMESEIKSLQLSTQLFLTRIESEINLVMRSTGMRKILDEINAPRSVDDALLENAELEFLNLMADNDYYKKASLLNKKGKEIISIINSKGGAQLIPRENLSKTLKTYYKSVVQGMDKGELFLSPAEIQDPVDNTLLPIIDFILPIYNNDGNLAAIVSLNISAGKFFELLLPSYIIPEKKIFIVNQEGYYIFHSEKKNTWNELFTNKSDENIHKEYSPEIVNAIFGNSAQMTLYTKGRIIQHSPIFSGNKLITSRYYIVEDVSEDVIMGNTGSFRNALISIIVIGGIISIVLGYFVAQLFLKPVRELVEGTKIIRGGNLDYKLEIKTSDEIQDLIDNFNELVLEWKNKQVLEKENRKLSESVEQSPTALIITDTDFFVEYINPRVRKLSGYTREDIRNKRLSLFATGLINKEFSEEDITKIFAGNTWKGEIVSKDKNGENYWELATISAITDNTGAVINFLIIKEDITERKKMIEEIIDARDKAERAGRLKSEFLLQMSHEIRTPLNIIGGVASILEDELMDQKDPQLHGFLDSLKSASARIIRTIESILLISELKTGTYQPQFKLIMLDEALMPFMIKEAEKYQSNKSVSFELDVTNQPCPVEADEYSLYQILSHLIDNAFKYTKEGKVIVRLERLQDAVKLCVCDTGIGMTEEFLEKIFSPFSQEDQGLSRPFEGNGLGLALIKEFCKMNTIELSVESIKHKGTTFSLSMKTAHT